MALPTPPGYGRLVPLDSNAHRGLGVRAGAARGFGATLNAVYLTVAEFFAAVRHYPIVFVRDEQGGEYVPVAVTALERGANLFVTACGEWEPGVYVPAWVRRYPFYAADLPGDAEGRDAVVCVDETALDPAAPPLFDETGAATDVWRRHERFVSDMQAAVRQTTAFARTLAAHDLLEPFEARALQRAGSARSLRGMHRVSEERMNGLDAGAVKELMARGELSRVYAHLISLEGFGALLDRTGACADADA